MPTNDGGRTSSKKEAARFFTTSHKKGYGMHIHGVLPSAGISR